MAEIFIACRVKNQQIAYSPNFFLNSTFDVSINFYLQDCVCVVAGCPTKAQIELLRCSLTDQESGVLGLLICRCPAFGLAQLH